jgi:hypothetical protein
MDKTFTIAGTSTDENGATTYRFANGESKVRTGVLRRAGHTNIDLKELPSAMPKEQAISWLNAQGIVAVLPKTGRGNGTKPEASPEQVAVAEQAAAELTAQAEAVAVADAEFLANLGGSDDGVAEQVAEATPAG